MGFVWIGLCVTVVHLESPIKKELLELKKEDSRNGIRLGKENPCRNCTRVVCTALRGGGAEEHGGPGLPVRRGPAGLRCRRDSGPLKEEAATFYRLPQSHRCKPLRPPARGWARSAPGPSLC